MSRRRAPIKRAGYEHANLSAHARAAFAIARAEFDDLGERQREALISCEPGVALAAVMRTEAKAYQLRVRRSLQLRALLKSGEAWELTAWGAIVREAGGTCEGAMVGKQGNAMNTALKTLTIGIALYTIPACGAGDERRALVELRCDDVCEGRWDDTDLWSLVFDVEVVLALPEVDPDGLWECDPDPDVDMCAIVDTQGRAGCFRVEGAWAVAVAPACVVDGWLDVGMGMAALAVQD